MNSFTARKIKEGRALYEAMCKGKVAMRGIHKFRNGKRCQPIVPSGFPYHGHVTFDQDVD